MFFEQREITRECPAEVLLENKMRIAGLFRSRVWILNNVQVELFSLGWLLVCCGGVFLCGFFPLFVILAFPFLSKNRQRTLPLLFSIIPVLLKEIALDINHLPFRAELWNSSNCRTLLVTILKLEARIRFKTPQDFVCLFIFA